jgi:hypothetical protein
VEENNDETDYEENFISGMTVQKTINAAEKNKKDKLPAKTRSNPLTDSSDYEEQVGGVEKKAPEQPKVISFSDSDDGTTGFETNKLTKDKGKKTDRYFAGKRYNYTSEYFAKVVVQNKEKVDWVVNGPAAYKFDYECEASNLEDGRHWSTRANTSRAKLYKQFCTKECGGKSATITLKDCLGTLVCHNDGCNYLAQFNQRNVQETRFARDGEETGIQWFSYNNK